MIELWRKELREHAMAFLLLFGLAWALFGFILLLALSNANRGNLLQAYRVYLILGVPLGALFLGHRLITREYSGKTQLFLEGLPVSRITIFWAKCSLGMLMVLALALLPLAFSFWVYSLKMPSSPRFIWIVFAKTTGFALFVQILAFNLGFLGRYRIFCVAMILIAGVTVEQATNVEFTKMGPFALVSDNYFAFERHEFPTMDLQVTLLSSLAFLLLSLAMALGREGSVAAMLSQKMSHREKVFLWSTFVGAIIASTVLDEKQVKEPFNLVQAVESAGHHVTVKLGLRPDLDEDRARDLTRWLHGELVNLENYLGLESLPPVFLTLRPDLAADTYELGKLENAEGVLVRLSYQENQWDPDRFLIWLIPNILINQSHGRVKLEKNYWLLEGFALYWQTRHKKNPAREEQLWLRALYAAPKGPRLGDLENWLRFREKVGKDVASGLAWSGLAFIEQHWGEDACRGLLREKLGGEVPEDVRAVLLEHRHAIERIFPVYTGTSFRSFLQQWRLELDHRRKLLGGALAKLPKVEGEIRVVKLSPKTRRLEYRLRLDDEPNPQARVQFRYVELPRADLELEAPAIRDRESSASAMSAWSQLPRTYGRGTRFAWTFSLFSEKLGCDLISGWRRMEIGK